VVGPRALGAAKVAGSYRRPSGPAPRRRSICMLNAAQKDAAPVRRGDLTGGPLGARESETGGPEIIREGATYPPLYYASVTNWTLSNRLKKACDRPQKPDLVRDPCRRAASRVRFVFVAFCQYTLG